MHIEPKTLVLAGIKIEDAGYYEINEAFVSQFLACDRNVKIDPSLVYANGSGIGLGQVPEPGFWSA